MANSLTNLVDKILVIGLEVLRENAVMARLGNTDYQGDAVRFGQTIDIPISKAQTVSNVTPSETFPTPASTSPAFTQVTMDQWKKTNFHLTDKEMLEIDRNETFLPRQTTQAAKSLANTVDVKMHTDAKGVYGFVGTPSVVPFSTIATATDARKVLNEQLADMDERRLVLDPTAEGQALQLPAFSDLEKTGDSDVKIQGELGRKFGFDFVMSQNVQTHTAGTASLDVQVGSTTAIGVSTLKIAAGSTIGTLVTGDVFTIAGDTQTYVITGASTTLTSAGVDFTIAPALQVIASATSLITPKATHVNNLAFHRDAFVYVTRPLERSEVGNGIIRTMQDDMTGVGLRVEVVREHKQTVWEFDLLYGTKLVWPEKAVRIAG